MANATINAQGGQFGGFTPYGNLTTLRYTLETRADGAPLQSHHVAPLVVGDVVRFQYPVPAGFVMEDLQVIVATGFGADVTADIGFSYADGVDDVKHPQDAAYFGAGIAMTAIGRTRTTSSKALFALPKDAFLIMTVKGADIEQAGKVQIVLHGERLGAV